MNKIKIPTVTAGGLTAVAIPEVEENKKSIEENLKKIQENQQIIQENQKRIGENKEEIEKLREEYRWLSESSQARLERINKRLYIIIIILIGLLAVANIAWIYNVDNMLNIAGWSLEEIANAFPHEYSWLTRLHIKAIDSIKL